MEKIIVTICAGHGGIDSGAIGPTGLREKDCALAVARKAARLLAETGRFQVHLLRDSDVYLGLAERGRVAAKLGSRCHVEVHVNASNGKQSQACVYRSLHLPQDAESADRMSEGIARALGVKSAGEKTRHAAQNPEKDYYSVLEAAFRGGVPHAFVPECGYIDHPETERKLRDPAVLQALAEAIAQGVAAVFDRKADGNEIHEAAEKRSPAPPEKAAEKAPGQAKEEPKRVEKAGAKNSVPVLTVAPGNYYVRERPDFGARILGAVAGGERYAALPAEMNFRQIIYKGAAGYVGPSAWKI